MVEIQTAIVGLKYIRDFSRWVSEMRQDAEILSRVNEAMRFTGEVQDKLQELREENLQLLEENRRLAEQVRAIQDWHARRASYQLAQTAGGAHVLRAEGPPAHYACPSCAESKHELHVLQKDGSYAGTYSCPACRVQFNVDPEKPVRMPDPYRPMP